MEIVPEINTLYRKDIPDNKVAIMQGSGSGHEPAHIMCVGRGMLDAACPGAVFAAPPMNYVYECTKKIATSAGVLHIINNYQGDKMSWDMGREMAEMEGIKIGTDKYLEYQQVGHPMNSYWVFQQAYDKNGKAIEGAVVDRNGDGQITNDDRYFYKSPAAPVTMGLASRLEYKNWDFSFSLRANLGNYVYDAISQGFHNVSPNALWASTNFLTNKTASAVADNWATDETSSTLTDRWVHNASFLKCDNITLGYSFENLFKCAKYHGISGRAYVTASNVFTITNYDGIDPEVFNGYDNNVYPRPFSLIVGLNLNF